MTCWVNLQKTKYKTIDFKLLDDSHFTECEELYKGYIQYKDFNSIYPIYREDWTRGTVFGYYDNNELAAWSCYYVYPSKKIVHADQFAWNYKNPRLKLGYKSLRSECAYFREQGFNYLILGDMYSYKQEMQGFEIITYESKGAFES